MRKTRLIESCRCYHLISRLAHRAFFLDDEETKLREHGRPTEKFVSRIGEYRKSFVRRMSEVLRAREAEKAERLKRMAVGMKSRIHFIRYYIAPMLEKGLIVRTDPDHPQSPQQEYKLA